MFGHAAIAMQRQAPEQRSGDQWDGQPGAMHERHDDEGAEQRTETDRGVQNADAALAEVQQREGGDDDEDVDAAGGQRLTGEHAREQAEVGRPPRDAEAGEQELPERRMTARAGHGGVSLIGSTSRADQSNETAITTSVASMPETASTRPASAGPANIPRPSIVVAMTFAIVSSSGVRERLREEGDLRRSERRPRCRRQPREDVDERIRSVGHDDDERAENEQRGARTKSLANITHTRR